MVYITRWLTFAFCTESLIRTRLLFALIRTADVLVVVLVFLVLHSRTQRVKRNIISSISIIPIIIIVVVVNSIMCRQPSTIFPFYLLAASTAMLLRIHSNDVDVHRQSAERQSCGRSSSSKVPDNTASCIAG